MRSGLVVVMLFALFTRGFGDDLERGFVTPPDSARPWVYWFWLNGNITREGVTADLEAMKRVGIGGALVMEVDQGAPVGPVNFMGARWRELFKHVNAEARRLGLEVNMNDDAGWNGSGGPWIRPEDAMHQVAWTETRVAGPRHFDGVLPQPKATAGFYRDIAVLAFPTVGDYRLPDIAAKGLFQHGGPHSSGKGKLTPEAIVKPEALTDLTARMKAGGHVLWDAPAGAWTLLRIGYTCTGAQNAPAPATGRGLECDKLSKAGIEAQFAGMMAKLVADTGGAANRPPGGLVATHIDSWENGRQNWTARMPAEFRRRRGYDLTPYLPILTGRVVGGLDVSERFLWDVRQTVSELVIENYAGHFRKLANEHGLRFTVEAYGGPCDCIPYGGQADEPMGEFWTPGGGAMHSCRGMASAGHIYGKRIIGAEAFTSGNKERWREHPGLLKPLADRAFCEGINRFVFHRYAMQPWLDVKPGMTMGPWGQHYERTQTWWEQSRAWHAYLARCQFMLRQGLFVADICYLQPEAPPLGFGGHPREGYDWDECTADAVLTRMAVHDGRLVLPDGMSYRVLALPKTDAMTPALLRKIKTFVDAGATVVGTPPSRSPSLSDYPACDKEVKQLADSLWADGKIEAARSPEQVLAEQGVAPDFTSDGNLRYIHRRDGTVDIYFVANPQAHAMRAVAAFRVSGRQPELWWPESGHIEPAVLFHEAAGVTRVALALEAHGSVFVLFRQRPTTPDPVVILARNGEPIVSVLAPAPNLVITKAVYGVLDDPQRTRDVRAKIQRLVDAGQLELNVTHLAAGDDPSFGTVKTLVIDYTVDGNPLSVTGKDGDRVRLTDDAVRVGVEKAVYGVLSDPQRTRDVRAKVQQLADNGKRTFQVALLAAGDDPAYGVVKTAVVDYTIDGKHFTATGTDPELISLTMYEAGEPLVDVHRDAGGDLSVEAWQPGRFELKRASGRVTQCDVAAVPPPVSVAGPWRVAFDPKWGGPASVTFDTLEDWSRRPENGIRYYSGAATYTATFTLPASQLGSSRTRVALDLGKVAVMAEVTLNGKPLGILWKPPYRMDVTHAVHAGVNTLEVKVVNLWINRMIGDEQLPEDSDRNPNGTLKAWPAWLEEGKPSPTGRYTFTSWRLWKKDEQLQESGLLGPVVLRFAVVRTL